MAEYFDIKNGTGVRFITRNKNLHRHRTPQNPLFKTALRFVCMYACMYSGMRWTFAPLPLPLSTDTPHSIAIYPYFLADIQWNPSWTKMYRRLPVSCLTPKYILLLPKIIRDPHISSTLTIKFFFLPAEYNINQEPSHK